ncbi:hypothetical protein MHC_03095 [Mycoplasma haemocanis str. Illinois]|uniref:Uncharacterized protein n=1 Tax=Mycoplasma haemocanis (strain Illinois) TaxID=1111676 RepID=H6N757_MYCHN|nr:hypothetical protein [Mycoplasma haemocanis]AEW45479.1 hypothetical protein MHC_03095 [Mycoplasma haemocanis str. Illinois]
MANIGVIIPTSLAGVVVTVAGGAYLIYGSSSDTVKTLFKDKFRHALMSTSDNKDDSLWGVKWESLKKLGKAKNSKISQALRDHKSKSIDDDIRGLLKQGCQEIYDSEFLSQGDEVYDDFKNVCSRNIKDKLGGTWLASSDGKIAEKWTSLSQAGLDSLTSELKAIKSKDETNGKAELQKWCDSISTYPYDGDGTLLTNNATSYCKVSV